MIKEFGNEQGTLKNCDLVQLAVKGRDNLTVYVHAFVVDTICSPIANQTIDQAKIIYPHLRGLALADSGDGSQTCEVDLMIGADFCWCFMLDHVVRGDPLSPIASLTRFGYVLSGPMMQLASQNDQATHLTVAHVLKTGAVIIDKDQEIKEEIHKFWDYETLGVKGHQPDLDPQNEENPLKGKIEFKSDKGRYQICLPFKDHPVIPAISR